MQPLGAKYKQNILMKIVKRKPDLVSCARDHSVNFSFCRWIESSGVSSQDAKGWLRDTSETTARNTGHSRRTYKEIEPSSTIDTFKIMLRESDLGFLRANATICILFGFRVRYTNGYGWNNTTQLNRVLAGSNRRWRYARF